MSKVIIDDQNSNVTRSGTWKFTGAQPEYMNTSSYSSTNGSIMKLTFYGSNIDVYGTVTTDDVTTKITYQVDSFPVVTSTTTAIFGDSPEYHYLLFSAAASYPSTLSLGSSHTIQISVTSSSQKSTNINFDYFLVTVPDTSTYNNTGSTDLLGQTLVFDDAEGDGITYSGSWTVFSSTDEDFQGTLSTSGEAGDTATLNLSGTRVTVYGSVDQASSGSLATFTIDGNADSSTNYSVPTDALPFTNGVSPNTEMFKSDQLSPGPHTLVMTALGSDFNLDYVTVTGFALTGTNTAPSDSSPSPTGRHASTAEIGGGSAAGFVVLCLVLSLLSWWRRPAPRTVVGPSYTVTQTQTQTMTAWN